ncbi:MltR family transcriptional regulator [Bradyrhizobium sp. OAE829]|uniref:MltR family transcriptional regulator n=1 Tax=Bradyrhizobium sp. OAE829 TaxID=2663807 RepID=UPI00178B465D
MLEEVKTFVHMHKLSSKGHASEALLTAAILDQELRTAILLKMRPSLSAIKQERLFEGYGPLAEFGDKIEVAFALGQIDDSTYSKLKIIKDIRNKFAHLPKQCTFWTREISLLIDKFHCKEKATQPQIFALMAQECFDRITGATTEVAPPA